MVVAVAGMTIEGMKRKEAVMEREDLVAMKREDLEATLVGNMILHDHH